MRSFLYLHLAPKARRLKPGATRTKSVGSDYLIGSYTLTLEGAGCLLAGIIHGLSLLANPVVAAPTSTVCQDTRLVPPDCYPLDATSAKEMEALHLKVIVNSNQDGAIQPDDALTLREAIQIVNGTLPLTNLSEAEKAAVRSLNSTEASQIEFNLPAGQTTIRLIDVLPPLASPGLVVDGTTQPGYQQAGGENSISFLSNFTGKNATEVLRDNPIPVPVVTITPAENAEVFRGLTVIADRITIRGLNLYGFTAKHKDTAVTPPADIFIADRFLPPDSTERQTPGKFLPFYEGNVPPNGVVIENNWLGILTNESTPSIRSAFGVSVFNSLGTTIRQNVIAGHDGSAIITSVRAENLQVTQNLILGNGVAGMPDAIRLEGIINNSQIRSNLITENDGSAIFLFKPQGSVQIQENQIQLNGRRLRRAAIYVMGNEHQVMNNKISNQNGAGVVVASYPQSDRNIIRGNQFSVLDGLSIDLNAQHNVEAIDYQQGDGPNPPRNSPNRRKDTGNGAINTPEFLAREFFLLDGKVNLDGVADPGSQIEIYRTRGTDATYNPLNESLGVVETDMKGKFSITLSNLQPGDRVSAIATDPKYGTSEPAVNAVVRSLDGGQQ